MKKFLVVTGILFSASTSVVVEPVLADACINGYYLGNGTYVQQPHYCPDRNGDSFDNSTTRSNTNPYTGSSSTRDPYYNYSSPTYPNYPSSNYYYPRY